MVIIKSKPLSTVTAMSDNKKEALKAFTSRLETLLVSKGKTLSPTALARDFNLRWRGVPVTVNATRKWLMGQAMPTMDKLSVLANMLNTSEDWLRWGASPMEETTHQIQDQHGGLSRSQVQITDKSFAQDFKLLNATNKKVVGAVMEVLLSQQQSLVISTQTPATKKMEK
jgi:hypothetical protein